MQSKQKMQESTLKKEEKHKSSEIMESESENEVETKNNLLQNKMEVDDDNGINMYKGIIGEKII